MDRQCLGRTTWTYKCVRLRLIGGGHADQAGRRASRSPAATTASGLDAIRPQGPRPNCWRRPRRDLGAGRAVCSKWPDCPKGQRKDPTGRRPSIAGPSNRRPGARSEHANVGRRYRSDDSRHRCPGTGGSGGGSRPCCVQSPRLAGGPTPEAAGGESGMSLPGGTRCDPGSAWGTSPWCRTRCSQLCLYYGEHWNWRGSHPPQSHLPGGNRCIWRVRPCRRRPGRTPMQLRKSWMSRRGGLRPCHRAGGRSVQHGGRRLRGRIWGSVFPSSSRRRGASPGSGTRWTNQLAQSGDDRRRRRSLGRRCPLLGQYGVWCGAGQL